MLFGLLALLVVLMVLPQVHVVIAAFTIGGLMIVTRCISAGDARRNVQWHVLLTIAGAFGLANALETSGTQGARHRPYGRRTQRGTPPHST